jgi:hypothetical protein
VSCQFPFSFPFFLSPSLPNPTGAVGFDWSKGGQRNISKFFFTGPLCSSPTAAVSFRLLDATKKTQEQMTKSRVPLHCGRAWKTPLRRSTRPRLRGQGWLAEDLGWSWQRRGRSCLILLLSFAHPKRDPLGAETLQISVRLFTQIWEDL